MNDLIEQRDALAQIIEIIESMIPEYPYAMVELTFGVVGLKKVHEQICLQIAAIKSIEEGTHARP